MHGTGEQLYLSVSRSSTPNQSFARCSVAVMNILCGLSPDRQESSSVDASRVGHFREGASLAPCLVVTFPHQCVLIDWQCHHAELCNVASCRTFSGSRAAVAMECVQVCFYKYDILTYAINAVFSPPRFSNVQRLRLP